MLEILCLFGAGARVFDERRDELVAAAVQRLDDALLSGVVAERTARLVHRARERRLRDVLPCPKPFQQFVFADDACSMLDQVDDELEHARLDRDGFAAYEQSITGRIDLALLEAITHTTRRGTKSLG